MFYFVTHATLHEAILASRTLMKYLHACLVSCRLFEQQMHDVSSLLGNTRSDTWENTSMESAYYILLSYLEREAELRRTMTA